MREMSYYRSCKRKYSHVHSYRLQKLIERCAWDVTLQKLFEESIRTFNIMFTEAYWELRMTEMSYYRSCIMKAFALSTYCLQNLIERCACTNSFFYRSSLKRDIRKQLLRKQKLMKNTSLHMRNNHFTVCKQWCTCVNNNLWGKTDWKELWACPSNNLT